MNIVMPCYIVSEELKELTLNTVNSFRKNSKDIKIVIVDDCSPMDTKFLEEIADIYIRNEVNSGFAISCNKGFAVSNDKYIVCSNNDIEVYDGWQEEITRPFELFENVGITGLISTKGKVYSGVPIEKAKVTKMTEGGLFGQWFQSGALWCSTREVLDRIGVFDEQFIRGGYEDIDLFLRARDTYGLKIITSGFSMFWHKEGATRFNCEQNGYVNNFGFESKKIEDENLQRFINKWGFNPHNPKTWYEKEIFNL